MKRKIGLLLFLIAGIYSFLFANKLYIKTIIIVLMIFVIFFNLSVREYRKYCREKFPGTINSATRNYHSMSLGKCGTKKKEDSVLDLTGYKRNFYTDCLLLQRYYSFLEPEGVVKIYIDALDSRYFLHERINEYDIPALHEVTLWEHGIDTHSLKYKVQLEAIGGLFLFAKASPTIVHGYKGMPLNKMQKAITFCRRRGLKIMFVVSHFPNDKVHEIDDVKEYVALTHYTT